MSLTALIGVAIIAMILCVIIRQYKPEYSIFISLTAGILILLMAIDLCSPVFETIEHLVSLSQTGMDTIAILLKALGICFITQLACDACKDAGESAIASKIELAGKAAVLVISLPLFEQIIQIATSLMTI